MVQGTSGEALVTNKPTVLCSSMQLESRDHLFFECAFATTCWESINIHWDNTVQISDRFITTQHGFRGPCFIEIAICATWNIWKEHNDFVFKDQAPSLARWKVRFRNEIILYQYRVKQALVQPLLAWVFDIFFMMLPLFFSHFFLQLHITEPKPKTEPYKT